MPQKTGHLNDHIFRHIMSEPETLGLFLSEHLPAHLVARFRPAPPEIMPGSFIDETLAGHHSDLLCRVQLKTGGPAWIHILIEHKSQPDPLTPLQLMRYMTTIWAQTGDDRAGESGLASEGRLPLVPIIPVVFYHGARRWHVAAGVHELFNAPPDALMPYLPRFEYVLIDLNKIDDDQLSQQLRLRVYLMAMKYNPRPDMIPRWVHLIFREFGPDLPDLDIITILTYILRKHEVDKEQFEHLLIEHVPERKEKIMGGFLQELEERVTSRVEKQITSRIEEQVKSRVSKEYFSRGKAEGTAEGKATVLLRQLSHRFGPLPTAIEQRIGQADNTRLDHWSLRIFDASRLEDVFEE